MIMRKSPCGAPLILLALIAAASTGRRYAQAPDAARPPAWPMQLMAPFPPSGSDFVATQAGNSAE
ncbi:MAG: hypothetical protein FJY56_19110 [Betaproteobacteria bacterium]|nr:hypothetical protein [Betaproteobacteria bacterium]